MTREEAIEQLQNCKDLIMQDGQDYLDDRDIPLLDMAIEALQAKTDGDLISRQDAIDALGEEPEIWNDTEEEWAYRNAWVEHISAIKALPSAEPCDKDAISREGLLRSWEELSPRGRTEFDQVIMTMPALPSAEPPYQYSEAYVNQLRGERDFLQDMVDTMAERLAEPKTGEWVIHDEVKNIYGGIYIECSECGTKFVTQTFEDEHFCRNCGARMRGEEE